jgi:cathepsin X
MGGKCVEIDVFPNATVAEFGMIPTRDRSNPDYDLIKAIQSEILLRGPVAATINAEPIVEYQGGVFTDDSHSTMTNHIVSIVGWGEFDDSDSTDGKDGTKKTYWIIRNSWGQYWGEMGYVRVEAGKNLLGIEGEIAWATPGSFTVHNFPCHEDGKNCDFHKGPSLMTQQYVDPSQSEEKLQAHLEMVRSATTDTTTMTTEEKRYVRVELA